MGAFQSSENLSKVKIATLKELSTAACVRLISLIAFRFLQETAEVQEVQLVSEEGVGAEDTAVLIQEAETVEYQCESNIEVPYKTQSLEDTVGSMKESVGLTQVAVKQGTTLKGSQQVTRFSMISES